MKQINCIFLNISGLIFYNVSYKFHHMKLTEVTDLVAKFNQSSILNREFYV